MLLKKELSLLLIFSIGFQLLTACDNNVGGGGISLAYYRNRSQFHALSAESTSTQDRNEIIVLDGLLNTGDRAIFIRSSPNMLRIFYVDSESGFLMLDNTAESVNNAIYQHDKKDITVWLAANLAKFKSLNLAAKPDNNRAIYYDADEESLHWLVFDNKRWQEYALALNIPNLQPVLLQEHELQLTVNNNLKAISYQDSLIPDTKLIEIVYETADLPPTDDGEVQSGVIHEQYWAKIGVNSTSLQMLISNRQIVANATSVANPITIYAQTASDYKWTGQINAGESNFINELTAGTGSIGANPQIATSFWEGYVPIIVTALISAVTSGIFFSRYREAEVKKAETRVKEFIKGSKLSPENAPMCNIKTIINILPGTDSVPNIANKFIEAIEAGLLNVKPDDIKWFAEDGIQAKYRNLYIKLIKEYAAKTQSNNSHNYIVTNDWYENLGHKTIAGNLIAADPIWSNPLLTTDLKPEYQDLVFLNPEKSPMRFIALSGEVGEALSSSLIALKQKGMIKNVASSDGKLQIYDTSVLFDKDSAEYQNLYKSVNDYNNKFLNNRGTEALNAFLTEINSKLPALDQIDQLIAFYRIKYGVTVAERDVDNLKSYNPELKNAAIKQISAQLSDVIDNIKVTSIPIVENEKITFTITGLPLDQGMQILRGFEGNYKFEFGDISASSPIHGISLNDKNEFEVILYSPHLFNKTDFEQAKAKLPAELEKFIKDELKHDTQILSWLFGDSTSYWGRRMIALTAVVTGAIYGGRKLLISKIGCGNYLCTTGILSSESSGKLLQSNYVLQNMLIKQIPYNYNDSPYILRVMQNFSLTCNEIARQSGLSLVAGIFVSDKEQNYYLISDVNNNLCSIGNIPKNKFTARQSLG